MDCLRITPNWLDFSQALCREFEPSEFDDSVKALFKLWQTGTLREYVLEFHHLANRPREIGHVLLKSCFIERLKKELKYDVKLLKPATVHDVIAIAIQLEEKLSEFKLVPVKSSFPAKSHTVVVTPMPHTVPRQGNLAIKKLTHAEIQKKRDRDECWFYTDKWALGHKCGLK